MDVVRLVEEIKESVGVTLQNIDVFMSPVFIEFAKTMILKSRGDSAQLDVRYDPVELRANNMDLKFPRQLFIDGQFMNGQGKPIDTINPHDESLICSVESGSPEDIDHAVIAAKRAFEEGEWSKISARERGLLLFK